MDETLTPTTEFNDTLKPHTLYTLGNARKFEETVKAYTGKEQIKVRNLYNCLKLHNLENQ